MKVRIFISIVALLGLAASICCGDDAAGQSRATTVVSKAMKPVKKVANKGAEVVEKTADGITVRVERYVNPQAAQPSNPGLLSSAARGATQLVRNVTVEVGRAAVSVGNTAVDLIKHTASAARDTVRQAGHRIVKIRNKDQNVEKQPSKSSSADDSDDSDSASEENGQAPAELTKTDA